MKVLERRTFDIPEKGKKLLELREICPGGWTIMGINEDGSEVRLGAYVVEYYAFDDFNAAVSEFSDYLTDEYNSAETITK